MRICLVLLLTFSVPALAQGSVADLLAEARVTAQQARERYEIDTPDQPLWREALDLAQRARQIAPENLDANRLLALLYSETNWHVRAYREWLDYIEAGGDLGAEAGEGSGLSPRAAFAEAGNQLGYSRYRNGNVAAAMGFYQTVLRHVPENAEALYWLGLLNFELDEMEAARSYFGRLLEVAPNHETAGYYISLIDEREQVGEEASLAYRAGLAAYDEGRLVDAYEAFVSAVEINPRFVNAQSWAGRTALEMGNPAAAVQHWEQVVEAVPEDEGASYFLNVARLQQEFGVEAGSAYQQGVLAYGQGDIEAAAESFGNAVEANPNMVQAWEWAARTRGLLGQPDLAEHYWSGVLERRPGDDSARAQLELSRQQQRYGVEAGRAFADAVRHYQLGEFEEAEQGFRRAVELNSNLASAWGWLGRLYFTRADYEQAADAYARASELEPGNDDYAFFAEEARYLAGEVN